MALERHFLNFLLRTAVLCLLATSGTFAQKRVLVLGSSTSACTGPSVVDSCYIVRLQKYYQSQGVNISIDNRATGGYSIYKAMPTGFVPPAGRDFPDPTKNITSGLVNRPDVVLVNYPSNGYDVFSVSEVMFCLRTIKQAANDLGIPCFITSTQPRQEPLSFRTPEVKKKMVSIKDSVLAQFGRYGIDFFSGAVNFVDTSIQVRYNSGDGVHLNDGGHRIFFEKVRDANILAPNTPLNVTTLNINARHNNEKVEVFWTAKEINSILKFVVEKSNNGIDFKEIGWRVIEGNISMDRAFSFNDLNPSIGRNYYRLKEVRKDGNFQYSSVIAINVNLAHPHISVFPNPVTGDVINLKMMNVSNGRYRITVDDKAGRRAFSGANFNYTTNEPSVKIIANLPKGIHTLSLVGKAGVIGTTEVVK